MILPHLDERATRLLLGAEARSLGHGGIAAVARVSGAALSRVQQGVNELEAGTAPLQGVRKPGAGRKTLTEKDPGLVLALLALVEPTRRGDPESPLSWTTLSTAKLATELTEEGHRVGAESVVKLLKDNGFSLQGNAKTLEGGQRPDRDQQFAYLNAQATGHLDTGQPVISIDAKKKELVGSYTNKGAEWRPAGDPEKVKVHDFIDKEHGKANPYGVYDVGTDHDTAAFAVNTIRSWWNTAGRTTHPGASKWKIEHKLFSHISMNWRGRPLTSHEVIVNSIATTTTGLRVHAELDTGIYPTGVKIPDQQMASLESSGTLNRYEWHPEWNTFKTGDTPTKQSVDT